MIKVIEYAKVSPAVLANRIEALGVFCMYNDIDEDYFSISVVQAGQGCPFPSAEIEAILQKYC
jgi:hypothetical protein